MAGIRGEEEGKEVGGGKRGIWIEGKWFRCDEEEEELREGWEKRSEKKRAGSGDEQRRMREREED